LTRPREAQNPLLPTKMRLPAMARRLQFFLQAETVLDLARLNWFDNAAPNDSFND
jgi:hypothetical protein